MIYYEDGDIFDNDVEAIVNPVNTIGVMGKGLALRFKLEYPKSCAEYINKALLDEIEIGKMLITSAHSLYDLRPKWIIHFPTKIHWRNDSQLDWITQGLIDLRKVIIEYHINSIALPAIGCGCGNLEWKHVRDEIDRVLYGLENVLVKVYQPQN